MASNASERIYTQNHVWLSKESEDTFILGITEFAQNQLDDIVFVELPMAGTEIHVDQACLVVESVKSASDVISPIEGVVSEVNQTLVDEPELINESPYEKGWILKVKVSSNYVIEGKMSLDEYNKVQAT